MSVAIAGQSLIFRTTALIAGNSKLIFNNRIHHVNVKPLCMGLKNDAKALVDSHQIPEKPKRPLTAYFKYMLEKRPAVIKANPSLHNKEVVKIISKEWNDLSSAEKSKYEEAAQLDKGKYDVKILEYNAQLTPEQEEILQQIASDKREEKKKRMIKKENKASGKPKRPVTSFGIFIKHNSPTGKSMSEILPELKEKWSQLSETEKQKYQIQYQRNKELYEKDLAHWEAAMMAEGKSHLVRIQTLKKGLSFEQKIKKIKPQ